MMAKRLSMYMRACIFCMALSSVVLSACTQRSDEKTAGVAEPLRIGAVIPLSGESARYGQWIKNGLDLMLERANREGGIGGRSLQIIYEDDQAEPKAAAGAMKKLTGIGVPIVYGSWASSCVLAQAPIAERNQTILVGQAISPKIREAGEFVFRSLPDANHSLQRLVPFAVQRGAKRAAVLYINNDYGVDQAKVFKELLRQLGGEVVYEEGYDAATVDFRTSLDRVAQHSPDTLFLPGYSEVGVILKQSAEKAGGRIPLVLSSDPFENQQVLDIAGKAADGVYYPFFYATQRGGTKLSEFERAYKAKYGELPEGTAAIAYNALEIIVEQLRRVGPEPAKLQQALLRVSAFDGILGQVAIDSKGDFQLPMYIKTVRDGQFVIAE
jgi:branched-chain amino acid transport system substrate-binding protein